MLLYYIQVSACSEFVVNHILKEIFPQFDVSFFHENILLCQNSIMNTKNLKACVPNIQIRIQLLVLVS